ncbi:phenylalanine--tRNA ligase subunit alpha [Candidatus Karelsulcia muelleri]|uniref:Phenylalanine--tRNA ligase alpha subunit n=1 Tax=Candidatus Karelsulcia muelleri PSPU TaxID=1189303 RepID=A0AAD1B3L2_9FLAO|nr:phenylalanine--tRNA ligase subunit alpha [Candidatus Karelsulcia muelleri]BAO66428.1 phenylalanyl-tRNA synthetase subunit alpha [Candidatus Karelsulcia muelleri PSPU]
MLKKIKNLNKKLSKININSASELEIFRIKYLGKKGILNSFFKEFKYINNYEKQNIGLSLNTFKKNIKNIFLYYKNFFLKKKNINNNIEDLTKPGNKKYLGSRHPISIIKNRIINIFNKIGFKICEGPEIEDDWYNFTALNFPYNHPAREMQDTFFIKKSSKLLRTHTSSVQIRYLEKNKPPIRIISPGRVYRNENISSYSHCMFHQIEGLYLDKKVSFKDLKNTINFFIKNFFGKSITRLRPSYFPFTEPSAELDILWNNKWLEIIGCGMVDPIVLKNVNIDPDLYSGFAFGMGIERISLMIYHLNDIRFFFENDLRFLEQFKKEF